MYQTIGMDGKDHMVYSGAELVTVLQAEGYTQAETYGGPVALTAWTPYGKAPADVAFVRNADGTATDAAILDVPPGTTMRRYFGCWVFTR